MAQSENYIIEFNSAGASIKVTAVDPKTGVEASIIAPRSASQTDMTRLAVRKLEYVLNKQKAGQ